eukprot:SAG31_NODE_563_length_14061_cov_15.714224_7_plen_593_part_00
MATMVSCRRQNTEAAPCAVRSSCVHPRTTASISLLCRTCSAHSFASIRAEMTFTGDPKPYHAGGTDRASENRPSEAKRSRNLATGTLLVLASLLLVTGCFTGFSYFGLEHPLLPGVSKVMNSSTDSVVVITSPDTAKLHKLLRFAKDVWSIDQSTLSATIVASQSDVVKIQNSPAAASVQVKVQDLAKQLAEHYFERNQKISLPQSFKADNVKPSDAFFNDYRSMAQITKAMKGWVAEAKTPSAQSSVGLHPNAHFNGSIGKTWENRDIPMITVGAPGSEMIYIQGTMHAREWIAATTALWIAKELLTSNDPNVIALVRQYQWVIVPVANPDGYEFSRTLGNRLWRKNRNPNYDKAGNPAAGDCVGVDMNRNWGESWHLGDPKLQEIAGADGRQGSDDKCTYVYRGKGPFSEKETAAIQSLFADYKKEGYKPVAAVDLHSYSQTIMYPYGFTKERPANFGDLKKCADRMKKVIDVENQAATGTSEVVTKNLISQGALPVDSPRDMAPAYHPSLGPTSYRAFRSVDLYPAFGEFSDWAHADGTDKGFSYCIELPDGPMGQQQYGFELPPNEIRSVGRDIFASVAEMAKCISKY